MKVCITCIILFVCSNPFPNLRQWSGLSIYGVYGIPFGTPAELKGAPA